MKIERQVQLVSRFLFALGLTLVLIGLLIGHWMIWASGALVFYMLAMISCGCNDQ